MKFSKYSSDEGQEGSERPPISKLQWKETESSSCSSMQLKYPRSTRVKFRRGVSYEAGMLHDLEFSPRLNMKGLYFDGHEREDVVEYCKKCNK